MQNVFVENIDTTQDITIEDTSIQYTIVVESVEENEVVAQLPVSGPSSIVVDYTPGAEYEIVIENYIRSVEELGLPAPSSDHQILEGYLDGTFAWVNPYTHPSFSPISLDAITGQVIDTLTTNSSGHVTGATLRYLVAADIPTLPISKITGLQTALDDRYTETELQTSGSASVHWDNLTDVPTNLSGSHSDLDDLDTDDHTQYALLAGRSGDVLKIDQIDEYTSAVGVTIDGVLLKDSKIGLSYIQNGSAQYQIPVTGATPFTPAWTTALNIVGAEGLNSLSYVSASFVKMTAANKFELDTNTYLTALPAHNLIDTTNHAVSGLTTGHFLKATGATSYGFAAHGLTYTDVGAAASSHSHYGLLSGSDYSNGKYTFYTTAGEGLVVGDDYEYESSATYEQLLVYSSDTLSGIRIQSGVNAASKWSIGTGCSIIGETSLYIRHIEGTNFVFSTSGFLTIEAGLLPDSHDGAYLGTAALGFSDLYLATGAVITFGAASTPNMTLTHSADLLSFSKNISIVCGSDADGDIWYRSSGKFARLAKGTAGQVLKMNSGATAPEWGTIPIDTFAALTITSSATTWNCSTGLNKTVSASADFTLTLTNFSSGMFGDLKLTVTAETTVTLAASGVTFKGNGSVTDLAAGVYHLCWVCTSSTTIEWNIAEYE